MQLLIFIQILNFPIQVLADEQKKLHPDCWKRKRSLSSANQPPTTTHSASHSPTTPYNYNKQSSGGPTTPSAVHSMPVTPTSHMSFLLPPHHPISPFAPTFNALGGGGLTAASAAAGLLGAQTVAMNPSQGYANPYAQSQGLAAASFAAAYSAYSAAAAATAAAHAAGSRSQQSTQGVSKQLSTSRPSGHVRLYGRLPYTQGPW